MINLIIAIVTIVFGFLVMSSKRLLRYLVGGYFILVGLLQLLGYLL